MPLGCRLLSLLLALLVAAAPAAPVHPAPKKGQPARAQGEQRAQPEGRARTKTPKPVPHPSRTTGPLYTIVLRPVSAGESSLEFPGAGCDNEDGLTVAWAPNPPRPAVHPTRPMPERIPRVPAPGDLRAGLLTLPPPPCRAT